MYCKINHKFEKMALNIENNYCKMCSNTTCGECKYAFMENCKTLFILDYLESINNK